VGRMQYKVMRLKNIVSKERVLYFNTCFIALARLSRLGLKVNAIYQVPEGLDKPVGLRKYPHKLSARTGDNLIPGEVRESTQELYIDGIKFIKVIGPTTGTRSVIFTVCCT
jgi:hypothetical protein